MKEALRAALVADAGVAGLVAKRVAWGARPRMSELPSIALHQVSGVRQYAMQGASGLVAARVQIDCWALSNKDATSVADAVNTAIGGLAATVKGVQLQGCFLESEIDFVDDQGATPAELLHRVSLDFMVWHSE